MKMNEMIEILKGFDDGKRTEMEVLERLEGTDPFYFYAAFIELYRDKDIRLEKGDSPDISKLFQKLYKEDMNRLISDLRKGHPVKELMNDHTRFEKLLDILQDISDKIEDGVPVEKIDRMKIILNALSHLKRHIEIEEELIFPVWYENKEWDYMDSFLLQEEHQDILKTYKKLKETLKTEIKNKNDDWKEIKELIDELIGKISFHTFHEGDIFYPIIVDQLSSEKFDRIEEKIDEMNDEKLGRNFDEYINFLSDPYLKEG